ncbi:MAG: hypothetical protein JZU53_07050 [Paludibacter sp.]|nr:hypothetical protein [Paludibacter sp.]
MKRFKNRQKTACGLSFMNNTWRVIRIDDNENKYYIYQVLSILDLNTLFRVYKGKKRLWGLNRVTMPTIMVLVNILVVTFVLLSYFPYRYFNGGYNFVRDTSWYNNVQFFNWSNIVFIIILGISLLLKTT